MFVKFTFTYLLLNKVIHPLKNYSCQNLFIIQLYINIQEVELSTRTRVIINCIFSWEEFYLIVNPLHSNKYFFLNLKF